MIKIPKQLQNENYRFNLLGKRIKEPLEKEWQKKRNYQYNNLKLINHLNKGWNYGIIGGYGNLILVDFDNEEIQTKIIPKLPKTFTVRAGGGFLHKYFISKDSKTTPFKILDKNKNTLADIQGTAKYLIAPGSTHPNGNKYLVVDDSPIAEIDYSELKALFEPWLKEKQKPQSKTFRQTDEIIQQIKDRISVSSLLNKYGINTKKNPTECPFHSSKGGKCLSFDDNKQVWNCFHCDESGDVFTLYMKQERLTFPEAKVALAKKVGIKITKISFPQNIIKIDDYYNNVQNMYDQKPFFYDKAGLFWFWEECNYKWEMTDDIDIMNALEEYFELAGETIGSGIKRNYIEAFKRIGRLNKPRDQEKHWVQFKDKIFNIKENRFLNVTPKYFICNPIPHYIGKTNETPIIDKLFVDWVGENHKQELYEIIAYCCLIDYPIHLIFCFIGSGRNGKSSFQELLTKFIGENNICSTELDILLSSRFENAKLYKKLVCSLGETNFGVLNKTSLLKRLTGRDLIGFEFKNKQPFDYYNYAKILINSNSLPPSEDTSEGFYRRWYIINFPNQFPEGKNIIESIPQEEYSALAKKVTEILPKLLKQGNFTNQGTIEERKTRYIMASNPLTFFINNVCDQDINGFVRYSELYATYSHYLTISKKRVVNRKEFSKVLAQEGFEARKSTKTINGFYENGYFVEGLKFKEGFPENMTQMTDMTLTPLGKTPYTNITDMTDMTNMTPTLLGKTTKCLRVTPRHIRHKRHNLTQNIDIEVSNIDITNSNIDIEVIDKIFLPCNFCGLKGNGWTHTYKKEIICDICLETKIGGNNEKKKEN